MKEAKKISVLFFGFDRCEYYGSQPRSFEWGTVNFGLSEKPDDLINNSDLIVIPSGIYEYVDHDDQTVKCDQQRLAEAERFISNRLAEDKPTVFLIQKMNRQITFRNRAVDTTAMDIAKKKQQPCAEASDPRVLTT